jgi:prepilin-type N-terminal cleavage/methylation domain-containing protein
MNTFKRTNSRRNGFTLIEVLVAAGLASIIFSVGYYAIATTIATTRASTQRIRDTENARLFFMMLERDLASASPGPGNIVKYRESTSATYSYTPSPLVIEETGQSDIIQFYCQQDSHAFLENGQPARDEMVFVRYYVNHYDSAHTLCRKSKVYDPNIANPVPPDETNPLTSTYVVNDYDSAVFDNVYKLTVLFQRWDAKNKTYVKESGTNPPAQCDSLLVTIVFYNAFAQSALSHADKSSDSYQTSLNNTYRSFSKVFSIPASFKQ